jgi:putative intracellular protease/amidase
MSRAAPSLSVFLLAALSGFILCAPEKSFPVEVQGAPQMSLKQQIHDFKSVLEGEILEYTFELHNLGDETLKIEQVKAECTCSVAEFDALIPPGGEGKITVRIETKGFEGKQRWTVKVFSNDPTWKEAVLDLRANVKPVITITGAPAFLGKRQKNPSPAEVEISTELDRELILVPEQFTLSDKVTYSLAEIEKGKRYKVSFQNVARKHENYKGLLRFKTNFAEKPDVTIWVIGRFEK